MFQTKVQIPTSNQKIAYENRIMTLGSCFAENIGRKLHNAYFQTDINPFGVLYNPVSISRSVRLLMDNKQFTETDLFQNRGLWQSFSHSSLFADTTAEKCLSNINTRFTEAATFFRNTDYLLITFGTAWVFEERESGSVVSNCHKLPANLFMRRRLTVDEIVTDYTELINSIQQLVPQIQVIFSISPIRHWKDGAHENNVSKSTLMLAVEQLQQQFERVHYFPAYEILMDELRDYRFYASDMLHPSDVAVDYIWSRFADTYFDEATVHIKQQCEQLTADLLHRPLFPNSAEFAAFQAGVEKRKCKLIASYPFLKERLK